MYGGPGLVDFQRFNRDLYDVIFALLENDKLAREFAQGVLSRAPGADDLVALRNEIREFTEPSLCGDQRARPRVGKLCGVLLATDAA